MLVLGYLYMFVRSELFHCSLSVDFYGCFSVCKQFLLIIETAFKSVYNDFLTIFKNIEPNKTYLFWEKEVNQIYNKIFF